MAILKLVYENDPMIRKVSRPVTEITPRILQLLDDMVETMRHHDGCGLAAVQVGVLRRVVVIEVEPGEVIELINPRIVAWTGHQEEKEGCLSLLGGPRPCKRYKSIKVQWQTAEFQTRIKTFTGWPAQIIQHEIDHCDGILI